VEWANYYHPRPWLVFDGDVSLSRSRFSDFDPSGRRIPGSLGTVVSLGGTIDSLRGAFGSLRLRYVGPRPLVEDDSVRSKSAALVNLEGGYRISKRLRIAFEMFNLFDAKASDIDYFYQSRLRGEPAGGFNGVHTHPTTPRMFRVNFIAGR
jgi:outer membrane receptor protein involved in Fe transport